MPTQSTGKVITGTIQNPADYVHGNCVNVKGEGLDITLVIPKNYSEKLSVVIASSNIVAGDYVISAGTYEGTNDFLEYKNGEFTAKSSQTITVQ